MPSHAYLTRFRSFDGVFAVGAWFVTACLEPNILPTFSSGSTAESTSTAASATSTHSDTADAAEGSSGLDENADAGPESESDPTATTTAGPPAPFCGDGVLDPGEQCDEGKANNAHGSCRPNCTAARCGDGDAWTGVEGCDDGPTGNVLEVGACAPDCSRLIEERTISRGTEFGGGDFGVNPVAFADSSCEPGSLAMFAYPGVREAALSDLDTSESIDWVLQPFTAYVSETAELIWITDDVPLLGVRRGEQGALENSVVPECEMLCSARHSVTGLIGGWTTRVDETCNQWSSSSDLDSLRVGDMRSVTAFLDDGGPDLGCDAPQLVSVYCVAQ
jgi:Protein of unknown function (DUF1554)